MHHVSWITSAQVPISLSEYKLSGVATPSDKKEGSGHKKTNLAVEKGN